MIESLVLFRAKNRKKDDKVEFSMTSWITYDLFCAYTNILYKKGSQRLLEENMLAFVPPGLDFACQVLGCIVTQQTLCSLRYYKVKFWYVKCEVEDICLVTWIIEEKA